MGGWPHSVVIPRFHFLWGDIMVTVTFTTRSGFTDTLFHIPDAPGFGEPSDVRAFASGVWWGATAIDTAIESIDVNATIDDGSRYVFRVVRGPSGMPDVVDIR